MALNAYENGGFERISKEDGFERLNWKKWLQTPKTGKYGSERL